ncbi:MAG: hypothetical protein IPJ19_17020 [Planctomycetes bacterium]|nr:hypothetical protein [Planctomycetota bacterium]
MSLPPRVSRNCARLRRVSMVFWITGLVLLLALGRSQRYWTGPAALFLCALSIMTGLAGLVALLFSEDASGEKEHDPRGVVLGLVGVLGAFLMAFVAAVATPSQ